MTYVEVLVADGSYHGDEALTYSASQPLRRGHIAWVPLRTKQVLAIVLRRVPKPAFAAKPIAGAVPLSPLPEPLIATLLWMHEYYPSALGAATQQFLPKKLPKLAAELQSAYTPLPQCDLPPLTDEQAQAVAAVNAPGTHLLHGDTGTGKTRVYIELAKMSVAAGRSAIILTPEIGLTSQLARSFREVFGDNVFIIHSQLTDTVRHKLWVQLLQRKGPAVVIGPRSALFSPLKDVGLIAIDEAHETAYKQNQAPHYHATLVAGKLAALHHAPLVIGSATPLVTDYYVAQALHRPILRMQTLARAAQADGAAHVVDLRDRSQFTKNPYLSNRLIAAVQSALKRHEQVLLFLNRRGTARVVFCESCGWQAACAHCDLPLVYHGDVHRMRCHTCTFQAAPPTGCPECQNASVVFKSIGTKAIAQQAAALFPEARVQRFDTDNKKTERLEQHYDAVHSGEIDILVGTQMLGKGFDLPKLGLVGVVIADTSLYFPDFSAQERTYQLLRQVVGRVSRGHRAGTAIIQTYTPDSPLLKAALAKDWQTFYEHELAERQAFLFPPFCYLLKLTCRRASPTRAQQAAEKLAQLLRQSGKRIVVEGPSPAFHEKVQNKYQWQLAVKAKQRAELTRVIRELPSGWSYDIDPMNLL